MSDRRLERGRATRERLVDVAREEFGSHGYDATSVATIIARAGVAKGALYHHFATKEELFDAVLDRLGLEVAEAAAERALGHEDPVESLKAGCGAWLEMALDPGVQRIALLDAPSVVGWARMREIDELRTLGGIRTNLERAGAAGDLDLLAHMVLAAVNEAALFVVRAGDPEAALAVAREGVDALIERLAWVGR